VESRKKCFSCSRLEPITAVSPPFVQLPDSRTCCLECLSSAVMTSDEAAALYAAAVDFMEAHLCLPIPAGMREVPVLAVDVHSVNEQIQQGQTTHGGAQFEYGSNSGGSVDYSGGGGGGSVTRGLTLSRCGEVTHYSAGDMSFSFQGGFNVGPPRVARIDTVREVTAVLVLYGLPADLTSSILAHEAMHVWLKLQKRFPVGIDLPSEEGLCQVVAHQYLQYLEDEEGASSASSASGSGGHLVQPGGTMAAPTNALTIARAPTRKYKAFGNPLPIRTGGFDFHGRNSRKSEAQAPLPAPAASTATQPKMSAPQQQRQQTRDSDDPNSRIMTKLRRYFLHSIETDRSEVYGDGYRSAALAVRELSLQTTLEHVREQKRLPVV